ncbi:MAG: hypothetical protein JXQ97_17250 [Natronospirillum sp.]
MKYGIFLLIFVSFLSYADNRWADIECEWTFFYLDNAGHGYWVVNSNQIVISITSKDVSDGFDILYQGPRDLGRGGMNLNWENYSKAIPIAEVRERDDHYVVVWKGFFDMVKGSYIWVDEADLVWDGNNVETKICD